MADHISNLPEVLTSHILSCLPTKEAIQTCVLSEDWKYKWTSISNINIIDYTSDKEPRRARATFLRLMDYISLSHNVTNFSLTCYGDYDLTRMMHWISAVLGPKLETLVIRSRTEEPLVLPEGLLLRCTSLKTLHIQRLFAFKLPAVHTFPNLVDLLLYELEIVNQDPVSSTVILNFPHLKSLKMTRCRWSNVKMVEIHAPALTDLASKNMYKNRGDKYSIQIMGANLSTFTARIGLQETIIFTGSQVYFAYLWGSTTYHSTSDIYHEFALQIRRILRELWSTNHLEISSGVAEAIALPSSNLCLPRYDKLEQLSFQYHVDRHDSLLELLHATPNLKILRVKMTNYSNRSSGNDVVGFVHSCIVSSLEEFVVIIGEYSESGLQLTKFLVENGKRLKKIHILLDNDGPNARDFLNKLSSFTKVLVYLEVVVDFRITRMF